VPMSVPVESQILSFNGVPTRAGAYTTLLSGLSTPKLTRIELTPNFRALVIRGLCEISPQRISGKG
jgi:hypothetical protein